MNRLTAWVVIAAAIASASPAAAAPLIDVQSAGGDVGSSAGLTLGHEFSLSEGYLISRLGFYDRGQDGLFEGHQIGVWDSGGTLVSSTTVAGGTAAPLEGFMRWADVDSLYLPAGTYTAGAHYPTSNTSGGDLASFSNALNFAPGVSLIDAKQNGAAGFTQPTLGSSADPGIFGPGLDGLPVSSLIPTALVDITDAGAAAGPFAGVTLGWEFTLDESKLIMDLGIFDREQNGLFEAHQVGLWDGSGTLLASTTVGAGTSAPLDGFFRYESISPLLLSAGTYTLGAHYPTAFSSGGDLASFNNALTFADGVTFLDSKQTGTAGFAQPTQGTSADPGVFGPGARFGAVPEPSTLVLFLIGAIGLIAARRRSRR